MPTNDASQPSSALQKPLFGPCDPWAITAKEREFVLRRNGGLCHRVEITVKGETRIAMVRNASVAASDLHLSNPANIALNVKTTSWGLVIHEIATPKGVTRVREDPRGIFTTSGRPVPGPKGFTWNPTPFVLTVMRAKTPPMAKLIARPIVFAEERRAEAGPAQPPELDVAKLFAPLRRPGRPQNPLGPSSRERFFDTVQFRAGRE